MIEAEIRSMVIGFLAAMPRRGIDVLVTAPSGSRDEQQLLAQVVQLPGHIVTTLRRSSAHNFGWPLTLCVVMET